MTRAICSAATIGWLTMAACAALPGASVAQGLSSTGSGTASGGATISGETSGGVGAAMTGVVGAAGAAAGSLTEQAEDLGDQVMRALSETLATGKGGAESAARAAAGADLALIAPEPGMAAGEVTPDPVVVELFTSQGCSSCPPADEILATLAARPDVIPLALHVDYWDYLGWEDPFAQPAFTARQKAYARAKGERMIYTPQMMVGGAESVVGTDGAALDRVITARQDLKTPVRMQVTGSAGQYQISLSANPPLKEGTVVQIVRYAPQARVHILRGENAGLELDYANVVTAWHAVAEWDGRTPTRLNARIEGEDPAVVIVQSARPGKSVPLPGPIVAARKLQ